MTELDFAAPYTPRLPSEWIVRQERSLVAEVSFSRKRTKRRRAFVVIAGTVAVVIAIVMVLGGIEDRPAFAGWSATPIQSSAAQLASVASTCQAQRASLSQLLPGFNPGPLPPYVLGDVRGPYSVLLYVNAENSLVCIDTPSGAGLFGSSGGSFSSAPSNQQDVTISTPAFINSPSGALRLVTGQAGTDVTSISITLSDGSVVTPTLSNGYFLAWWPSSANIMSTSFFADGSVHYAT